MLTWFLPYFTHSCDLPLHLSSPNFTATLVGLADLAGALSDPDATLTVLAPSDDAFAKLDNATVAKLTNPLYLPQLQQVLLSHVVDGTVTSGMVVDGLEATTLSGEKITFNTDPIRINENSVVTVPDIMVRSLTAFLCTTFCPLLLQQASLLKYIVFAHSHCRHQTESSM